MEATPRRRSGTHPRAPPHLAPATALPATAKYQPDGPGPPRLRVLRPANQLTVTVWAPWRVEDSGGGGGGGVPGVAEADRGAEVDTPRGQDQGGSTAGAAQRQTRSVTRHREWSARWGWKGRFFAGRRLIGSPPPPIAAVIVGRFRFARSTRSVGCVPPWVTRSPPAAPPRILMRFHLLRRGGDTRAGRQRAVTEIFVSRFCLQLPTGSAQRIVVPS